MKSVSYHASTCNRGNTSFHDLLTIITKYPEYKHSLQLSFYNFHIPSHILECSNFLKSLSTGQGSLDLVHAISSFMNVTTWKVNFHLRQKASSWLTYSWINEWKEIFFDKKIMNIRLLILDYPLNTSYLNYQSFNLRNQNFHSFSTYLESSILLKYLLKKNSVSAISQPLLCHTTSERMKYWWLLVSRKALVI